MSTPAYSPGTSFTQDIQHSYALHINASTVVAGDILTGYITLDIARAQVERLASLKIELHGTSTTIIYPQGFGLPPIKSQKTLLKLAPPQPLWSSASPSENLQGNIIPFQLALPLNLLPSFADGGKLRDGTTMGLSAKIEYVVVIRGARHGFFRTGLWVEKRVSIVKTAVSVEDVSAKPLLLAGPWAGAWRVLNSEMSLPHEVCAKAELWLPDLFAYPSNIPVPYRLRIIIRSPVISSSTQIVAELPEAPADPAQVRLQLVRRLDVEADGETGHVLSFQPLGGLGSNSSRAPVLVKVAAPIFAPCSPDSTLGGWQRMVHYEGALTFSDTPSFSTEGISVSHLIRLHVPVPRAATILAADWNVIISSGMEGGPPAFDFTTAGRVASYPVPEYTRSI